MIYHFIINGLLQSIIIDPVSVVLSNNFNGFMKLCLNLGNQDLAYHFGVHHSTIFRYFNRWLDVLYNKLSLFVTWENEKFY